MRRSRGFASDNAAPVHPAVLAAISAANTGHAFGYGHDDYTREVEARLASSFGERGRAFFVFNGTAANVLSLRAACRPWEAAICAATAHINVDECAAPESIAGVKLLSTETPDGRLTPTAVRRMITRRGDEHAVQPRVVSISESTELGTLYAPQEIAALAALAHEHGMLLHVDGARLCNAAAALDVPLRALSGDAGVDVVSFGATKNGALGAEAVIVLDDELLPGFEYLRKQSLQLASKMRFLAAQFDALLSGELWLANARHANAMAQRLADAVRDLPGLQITRPVQANAVFATLPPGARAYLHERFAFYDWDESAGEVRWMCSWDTTEADVEALVEAVRIALL